MREIKFRVWSNNIMSDLDLFHNGDVLDLMDSPTMQYTGLKDKNKKEIYEGDILSYNDNLSMTDEINEVIVDRTGAYKVNDARTDVFKRPVYAVHEVSEIIGNIYENKELLENET